MFCYQCQEAGEGKGCKSTVGVCGKTYDVANLQDLLVYTLKGVAEFNLQARKEGINRIETDKLVFDCLFSTITNTNFDIKAICDKIVLALGEREVIRARLERLGKLQKKSYRDSATWIGTIEDFGIKASRFEVGILGVEDEDKISLKSLILFGIKGLAAYGKQAQNLGFYKPELSEFIEKALVATEDNTLTNDELTDLVLETGKYGAAVMALLDQANTSTFGEPEINEVFLGVRQRPAILVSGHNLKDLMQLLEQTRDIGVDVYTHSEMLPAHYYPYFKKYDNLVGNYGGSWWKQKDEFVTFNGPILLTTNCIVPPASSYKDRVYTTGSAGYPGLKYIPEGHIGEPKDFSEIIEHAKKLQPPAEIERQTILGGFAHNQLLALTDKIIEAVKNGSIKHFFVMAGCDGRMNERDYYTEFAQSIPKDTIILTAGCAKYRYNKLNLGFVNGIPRVLDAGQCNDSYSLASIALNLRDILGFDDINDLPVSYNIAWYEQKSVIVLLALLYFGVKKIKLGPTPPAFLSPNVVKILNKTFGISTISNVMEDLDFFLKR